MIDGTKYTELNVSLETFNEIANGLEAKGIKVNADSPITIAKDVKIKGPIDYRQVQIRRDVLSEVVKVYKAPVDKREMEISDSKDFINYMEDIYQYILTGKKVETKPKSEPANKW